VTLSESGPRLLLATDGSQGSAIAEDYAFALARSWRASLTVMNVLESPPGFDPESPVNQLYLTELMKQATSELWALKARAVDRGISVHTRIATGIPSEEVVSVATGEDPDLIVVGTRGKPVWPMCCWEVRQNGLFEGRPVRCWPRALKEKEGSQLRKADATLLALSRFWCRSIFQTVRSMRWNTQRWLRNDQKPLSNFFMSWNQFRMDWTSRSPIGQSGNRSRQGTRCDYRSSSRRLLLPVSHPNS
jgi:nucleotide-binding universal stress UspA family protein